MCETEHPVLQVHPLSGDRPSSSAISFAGSSASVSGLGASVCHPAGSHDAAGKHGALALVDGDVVIWDNRPTQHKAIYDYSDQPRIVRRVTIDGPVSLGVDGRHCKR